MQSFATFAYPKNIQSSLGRTWILMKHLKKRNEQIIELIPLDNACAEKLNS